MSQTVTVQLLADVPEEWQSDVDVPLLGRVAEVALEKEGVTGTVEVELTVVDDQEIRRLNASFRGKADVTDVLSFPLRVAPGGEPDFFVAPPDAVEHLGDIVICYGRARAQAEEYGHSLAREIGYLFVHGLLHLVGYDHEAGSERERMRAKEEAALGPLGLKR
ncbi:MAG: rRNA maturation RNase YbeY [Chloroflexota bacterium]